MNPRELVEILILQQYPFFHSIYHIKLPYKWPNMSFVVVPLQCTLTNWRMMAVDRRCSKWEQKLIPFVTIYCYAKASTILTLHIYGFPIIYCSSLAGKNKLNDILITFSLSFTPSILKVTIFTSTQKELQCSS